MRRLIPLLCAVLFCVLSTSPVTADNDLHDKDSFVGEADTCARCHRAHTAQSVNLLMAGPTQADFCYTCHDGSGAETDVLNGELDGTTYGDLGAGLRGGGFQHAVMDPELTGTPSIGNVTSTHNVDNSSYTAWGGGALSSTPYYGNTLSLECGNCHNPHGNGNYRVLRGNPDGMVDEANATAVDVPDESAPKSYQVTYETGNDTSRYYRSASYVPFNLDDWCSQCHSRYSAGVGETQTDSGDAVFSYRHNTASLTGGCLRCHVAHGTTATMGPYSGSVPLPDGTVGAGSVDSRLLAVKNRKVCAECHVVDGGVTSHSAGADCAVCHGTSGSHAVHTTINSRGPATPLGCPDCHDTDSYPRFADGLELAATFVCDGCHSPGGAHDGVADATIGAKPNWKEGAYDGGLRDGKEEWCVGCHDDEPAVIAGVSAPDVSIFWTSGHGRSGAVDCEGCHDTGVGTHIDGDDRTYAYTGSSQHAPSNTGVDYQAGYRLRSVDGGVPLMIPMMWGVTFTGSSDPERVEDMTDKKYGAPLCFDSGCHFTSYMLEDNFDTYFKRERPPNPPYQWSWSAGGGDPPQINEHYYHLVEMSHHAGTARSWDSDWDSSTSTFGQGYDSIFTCSTCHNVHGVAGTLGSSNQPMIRDGSLTYGRQDDFRVGYAFSYLIWNGQTSPPAVTSLNANRENSDGAVFRMGWQYGPGSSNVGGICFNCHSHLEELNQQFDPRQSCLEYYRPYITRDIVHTRDLELAGSGWTPLENKNAFNWDFYRHDGNTTVGASATWTPDLPVAGAYEVYAWWHQASGRATNAHYVINHNGGSADVYVDQTVNGGQWNTIGTYQFTAGTSGNVVLTDQADGRVCADAVKFELLE